MAEAPHSILEKLVHTALELCAAHPAGISILENDGGTPNFRWYTTAGDFEPYRGGTIPGDFSPCGVVLTRRAPQLMANPELCSGRADCCRIGLWSGGGPSMHQGSQIRLSFGQTDQL